MSTFTDKLRALQQVGGRAAKSSIFLSDLSSEDRTVLRQEWPSIPVEQRRALTSNLVTLAEDNIELDYRRVFLIALDDTDARVRMAAIEGLYEDESKLLLITLLQLLRRDPDEAVRVAVAQSLGRFALLAHCGKLGETSQQVRETLIMSAQDEQEASEVRRRAVESLGYFHDDPLVEELIKNLYARGGERAESAVFAMGRSTKSMWAPIVIHELESTRPPMRYEAARAAGELGLEDAIPHLVTMADESDTELMLAALWSLGQIGGRVAAQTLQIAMNSTEATVREAAQEAMDELKFNANPLLF